MDALDGNFFPLLLLHSCSSPGFLNFLFTPHPSHVILFFSATFSFRFSFLVELLVTFPFKPLLVLYLLPVLQNTLQFLFYLGSHLCAHPYTYNPCHHLLPAWKLLLLAWLLPPFLPPFLPSLRAPFCLALTCDLAPPPSLAFLSSVSLSCVFHFFFLPDLLSSFFGLCASWCSKCRQGRVAP